jgi:RNA polymerase sigma-70 factor (ECF subfamily)
LDRALVEGAREGDRESYERLARAVGDDLFQVAYRILRDLDCAEDAVQRALVAIWRDLPNLRDPDRFEAWAYRVVTRTSLDEARHRRRHGLIRETVPVEPSEPDASRSVVIRDELAHAFDDLRPEHRAVVVLHYYVGLQLAEIAEILGIPYGTVGSRLHYALQRMRTTLGCGDDDVTDRRPAAGEFVR